MALEESTWTPDYLGELAGLFARLGQELLSDHGLDATLGLVCQRAVDLVPGAEHAAISRGRHGRFETVGSTSKVPLQVDQIQYDLHSGPCVDAAIKEEIYRTGSLVTDRRWPEFGRRANAEHGICSMLSVRLFLEDDDLVAALNLYSVHPDAFDSGDQTVAVLLATHASLAIAGARLHEQVQHLERALQSNRGIGVAVGVLMNRYKITQQEAFDLLRLASQNSHRKLVDVARGVSETGILELPPLPARAGVQPPG
ncbi:ANTAR domain-containing protein [Jatrophihabitans sp.]|uniref:ANTAR domain-containing protein n=1 Tax=Jatrophihabitans sp. TaxID=1932789 RepID=UPI002CA5B9A9|nr:GAF and ANTAR domain-containing protein [Jatrophihabitans sp.]